MSRKAKTLVKEFYENFGSAGDYLHPEVELFWNSSSGFHKMDVAAIDHLAGEISRAFHSLRPEVSHLLSEKEVVTIRFTYFVRTIENAEEELPMAHFIAIWELKDGKLHKGHQISQPADDSTENLGSFLSI